MSIPGPLRATEAGALEVRTRTIAARVGARSLRGSLALATLIGTTLLLALCAAQTDAILPQSIRPVPSWLAGPFGSTGFSLGGGGLAATLTVMFIAYVVAVGASERLPTRTLLMAIAAINALALLAPPLLSTDVFSYQFYGRMGAVYGASPYLAGPHALALDPLFPYIGADWSYTPSVYGPLFTLLSYVLAPLSIAASVLAYKALAALASIAVVALVWNAARLRGINPSKAIALVGLNPLVVIYGVGGGHNDLLMLAALLAGIYLVLARRGRSGGAMIIVSAAIKITGGLPLLFALAEGGAARARQGRRDLLIGAAGAAAAVAAFSFALFGTGLLQMFVTITSVQGHGDWHSIPGFISYRLGLGTEGHITAILLAAGFAVTCVMLLRRVWQGRMDWIAGAGWAAVALLLCAGSLLPWYVAWVMPLAALAGDKRLWRTALVMSGIVLTTQVLGYIPHGV